MTKYNITLYSKNKESLNNFMKFLKYNSKTPYLLILSNLLKKKKTKKKISVLKSPHVNKTAQEQFEYVTYSIKISFYSWEIQKYLILLKKIKNQLFPEINIKINGNFSKKKKIVENKLFNPSRVVVDSSIWNDTNRSQKHKKLKIEATIPTTVIRKKNLLKKTLLYLQILDCYGSLK